jgi:hypothetical protein
MKSCEREKEKFGVGMRTCRALKELRLLSQLKSRKDSLFPLLPELGAD